MFKQYSYCLVLLLMVAYAVIGNVDTTQLGFYESMQMPEHLVHNTSLFNREHIGFFKEQYEKSHFSKIVPSNNLKIPKKIHQIWLGSPFPEKYKAFQESWKKFHPDWQYILWTDKDIDSFSPKIAKLVRGASNFGEAADILRYAVLYKHGGLYVDTDFECLKPFDVLHYTYDFYVGLQPLDTNALQLNNALIGSAPKNPIFSKAFKKIAVSKEPRTIIRTGPILLTSLYIELYKNLPGISCAFPATYFYPCGFTQSSADRHIWLKPESFAIHHWEASWIKNAKKSKVSKR